MLVRTKFSSKSKPDVCHRLEVETVVATEVARPKSFARTAVAKVMLGGKFCLKWGFFVLLLARLFFFSHGIS